MKDIDSSPDAQHDSSYGNDLESSTGTALLKYEEETSPSADDKMSPAADDKNSETPSSHSPAQFDFDQVCRFLIKVGEVAHSCGTNSARLEHDLGRLVIIFGYSGVFFCTPSVISFSFQENELALQRTHISKSSYGIELNRLALLGDIVKEVVAKKIDLTEASTRMDALGQIPSPFGDLFVGICYPFVGAGLAILNQLSWWDTLFSALNSIVVFIMVWVAGRYGTKEMVTWLPISTGFVAGALTACTKLWIQELNVLMVTLNAILILIPGYPISVGVVEVVSNHVISGLANLFNGLAYLVLQFGGAWLGVAFVTIFTNLPSDPTGEPVDSHWLWLGVPMVILGLAFVFQTPLRDFFWVEFTLAAAYGFIRLGSYLLGGNLGNLFGTVVTVIIANIWARVTDRPCSIMLLPSIVLLVSGSIGFRGLADLASGEDDLGGGEFVDMFVVALTIAAGLLIGNTIIRPF
jgi:uncharacterized membrane protein YjjP (DUF1212 family)